MTPSVHTFDLKIQALGGTTFALGLQPQRLWVKPCVRPSPETCMVDLVRQQSALKRELRFFRAIYSSLTDLCDHVHSVSQEMTLNYFLRRDVNGVVDDEWARLAERLDRATRHFRAISFQAEQEWLDLEQLQCDREEFAHI